MSNPIEDDQHDGKCGHCLSQVPINATVCTRCGARWGTSTGKTREFIYREGRAKFILGTSFLALTGLFYLLSAYYKSPWILLPMVLAFFPGAPALGVALGGLIAMKRAKRSKITWWRET